MAIGYRQEAIRINKWGFAIGTEKLHGATYDRQ